ncbi:hypothetical protein HPB52_008671 [Rhipicephalus sanguineus]|uniref:CCHC-type domain-containing protein n=1 Tax=Rhipicephalus sanguineus TaxID=34632 RepID=A0A9D4QD09_RHISA|nr:hypothetical protein HPB52_008671 [Rhipicephalus sanguineus]
MPSFGAQDMDNLGGIPVEVVLPRGYSDNVAKISNVPLVYTDAQIRKFFAPAGVVAAKRQVAYRTQQDGSIKTIPRDSILLTFRPEREIPVRIRPAVEYAEALDYRYFPVRLHVTTPTQCYNCFRYGHMAKHCRRSVRCKVCAGDHSYKDCVSRFGQRCANCDGPHAATYGRCPARLAAVRDKRYALRDEDPDSSEDSALRHSTKRAKMHSDNVHSKYQDNAPGQASGSKDSHLWPDARFRHLSDTESHMDSDSGESYSRSDCDSCSDSDCSNERRSPSKSHQESVSKGQVSPSPLPEPAVTRNPMLPPKATYGGLGRRWLPAAQAFRGKRRNKDCGAKPRGWYGLSCSYDDDFKVEGIEVYFKTVGSAPSFLQLEIEKVTVDLTAAAKEPILFQRVTYNGSLVVVVRSAEAAARLLRVRNIAGYKVGVKVHSGDSNNVGKITNVPLAYSDEQLQEWFVSQGVIHARRQVVYKRQVDQRVERVPTFNVVLTFRPDKKMPTTVVPRPEAAEYLGDRPFVVRPHFEPPVQCMCCQRFGHMARYCLRTPRCKVCSGPHSYRTCDRKDRPRCANCHGPHAATFTRCPLRRLAAVEKRWSYDSKDDE